MPNEAENNKNNLVESNESILRKRKRIKRIKIGLIVTLLILILTPTVLCVILGFRMSRLEKKLDEISFFISMEDNSVDIKNKKNYAFASDAGLDPSSNNSNSNNDNTSNSNNNNSTNNGNTKDVSNNHDTFNNTNLNRGNTSNDNANNDNTDKDNTNNSNTSNIIDKDLNYNIDREYIDYVINPDNLNTGNIDTEDSNIDGINTEDIKVEDTNKESFNKDTLAHDDKNIYNSSIHKNGSTNLVDDKQLADDQQNKDLIYYGKKVYLTFDDGPSSITDEVLDILAEYDVKGTFFVVGHTDKKSKELYRRIVDEGHTLGIHSYSHKYSEIYNSVEDFDKDFTKLWKLLYDTTGYRPNIYRFPGGSLNYVNKKGMEEFIRYLNDKGITYFDWNVVNGDATGVDYTEEQMIDNVLNGVKKKNTSIVLMHDSEGKDKTLATLPKILEALISGGAQVLPLDETVPLIQQIKSNSVE